MQYFKGDDTEKKFYESVNPIATQLSNEKSVFFDEAYANFVLGELLYDNQRAPLARAIPRAVYREMFATLFDAFTVAGSFESYMTVFRQIFGDDVDVTFTVPAPGKLQIDIEAAGVELLDFIARYIDEDAYVYDEVIDYDGDNIVFQGLKGLQSQYEVEQMLYEMVPAGIYTEISLSLLSDQTLFNTESGDTLTDEDGDILVAEE